MEVECFVVDAPLAAHADDAGILNPLIKRCHEGLCAQRIFASPAVRVRAFFTMFEGFSCMILMQIGPLCAL